MGRNMVVDMFDVSLSINQCSEVVGTEEVAGHLLYLLGSDAVDVCIEPLYVAFPAVVEETLPETKCKCLAGITGDANLSLQLALGGSKLRVGESV